MSVTIAGGDRDSPAGGTVALGGPRHSPTGPAICRARPMEVGRYFSNPTSLVSTPAPTNGQVLIGSTGTVPALGTLTAGQKHQHYEWSRVRHNLCIRRRQPRPCRSRNRRPAHRRHAKPPPQTSTKLLGFLLPYNVTTDPGDLRRGDCGATQPDGLRHWNLR